MGMTQITSETAQASLATKVHVRSLTVQSFENFVRSEGHQLLRFATFISGDSAAAEDLVSTALASMWDRWSLGRIDNPAAYARTCVLHTARRRGRRQAMMRSLLPMLREPQHVEGPGIDRLLLQAALRALDPRQRAIIAMRFLEDQSVEAVAEALGIPSGTVKSATSRALATLREALEEDQQ